MTVSLENVETHINLPPGASVGMYGLTYIFITPWAVKLELYTILAETTFPCYSFLTRRLMCRPLHFTQSWMMDKVLISLKLASIMGESLNNHHNIDIFTMFEFIAV